MKQIKKIAELEACKIYDTINNPHPNHIYHYVGFDGTLYVKDIIVKTEFVATYSYN